MTDRVMLDLETLGTDPGSAILSIGAVEFDRDGPQDTFARSVDLPSCQKAGLEIDADTLDWWLDQGEAAREQLTGGDALADVLIDYRDWHQAHGFDEVWANSPSFDCEILRSAYHAALDEAPPWAYFETRDHRTVRELPIPTDISREGTHHDALDDARHQARVVAAALRQLDTLGGESDAE